MSAALEIHGFCEPTFAPLKEAFAANFADGLELGASLAATHQGRMVCDLWAGHADRKQTRPWTGDTIVCVFSTIKVAAMLCMLRLIDQGKVELDAPVARYWPEFAMGGKDKVTVRQAMTHQGGVPGIIAPMLGEPVPVEALFDWNVAAQALAAQDHWFGGEAVIIYHAKTYGLLLGEIIRRVDGRLPARYFAEEIASPANIDLQIGLTERSDEARLADLVWSDPMPEVRFPAPVADRAWNSVTDADVTTWEGRSWGNPTGSGFGNGRSIARMGAIAAMDGVLDGHRYLSAEIMDEATREQAFGVCPFMGEMRLGLGFGLDCASFPAPLPTSFHWGGYGGSLIVMDRSKEFSFGYAPNKMWVPEALDGEPFDEPRFHRLWDAIAETAAGL